jgi:hypothetical protein
MESIELPDLPEISDDESRLTESVEGESPQAYAAFVHWINLPPNERYAKDAAERVSDHFALAVSTVKLYRADFKWFERAKLIDAHFAKVQFNQRIESNREHNLQFAAAAREIQNEALEITKMGMALCKKLIGIANKEETEEYETGNIKEWQEGGTFIYTPTKTIVTNKFKAQLSDVSNLFRACVDVPRKIAGLPVETMPLESQTMKGEFKGKTKAELLEYKKKLQRDKAKLKGVNNSSELIN